MIITFSLISALIYHVPFFMELFGGIHQFSCNAIEAKNHVHSKVFFRSSRMGGFGSHSTKEVSIMNVW